MNELTKNYIRIGCIIILHLFRLSICIIYLGLYKPDTYTDSLLYYGLIGNVIWFVTSCTIGLTLLSLKLKRCYKIYQCIAIFFVSI